MNCSPSWLKLWFYIFNTVVLSLSVLLSVHTKYTGTLTSHFSLITLLLGQAGSQHKILTSKPSEPWKWSMMFMLWHEYHWLYCTIYVHRLFSKILAYNLLQQTSHSQQGSFAVNNILYCVSVGCGVECIKRIISRQWWGLLARYCSRVAWKIFMYTAKYKNSSKPKSFDNLTS